MTLARATTSRNDTPLGPPSSCLAPVGRRTRSSTIGERRWNSYNHIGNVAGTSDANGYFVEAVDTDAFGNPLASTQTGEWAGGLGGNRGLTTKELDPAAGLYYFYHRWYDPQTATFASWAPYPPMVEHAYGFAAGNPVMMADPKGEWGVEPGNPSHYAGHWQGGRPKPSYGPVLPSKPLPIPGQSDKYNACIDAADKCYGIAATHLAEDYATALSDISHDEVAALIISGGTFCLGAIGGATPVGWAAMGGGLAGAFGTAYMGYQARDRAYRDYIKALSRERAALKRAYDACREYLE